MEKSNPKNISYLIRFLLVFAVALILLSAEQYISPVVAQYDDECKENVSEFLPSRYKHFTSNMTCDKLWNTFILRHFETKDHIMTIILSAIYTGGWVSMAFSPDGVMSGSSAMVGWIDENNKGSIKQYFLEEPNEDQVIPDVGDIKLTHVEPAIVLYGSNIYLAFQMHFGSLTPQQKILLAFGDETPVKNRIKEHVDRTTITFDFSQAAVNSSPKEHGDVETMKNCHRVFSILGLGTFLPVGAIISRYYRHHDPLWYYLHVSIQSIGFIFVLVTILTGELHYNEEGPDISSHRTLGYLTLCLCILQVLAFVKRPSLDSKVRWYWNCYHALVGRTALFLGALNITIGQQIGGSAAYTWKIGYGVLLAATLVTVIILEALLWLGTPAKVRSPAFKTNLYF